MKQFLLAVLLIHWSLFGAIPLIVNGNNISTIVIDEKAPYEVQYAARELQHFLQIAADKLVPIQHQLGPGVNICLGDNQESRKAGITQEGLQSNGYKLITQGNNIYIVGKDRTNPVPLVGGTPGYQKIHIFSKELNLSSMGDKGTLHGVYYFLKTQLGCRWFMPGKIGEDIPIITGDHAIPDLNVTRNPAFLNRGYSPFLLDNDFNAAQWHFRVGFGCQEPIEIMHSFYHMNKYQKSNPEFFALYKGQRDFDITCEKRGNLCLTNPGLFKAYVEEARKFFDADPERKVFPIMPNDWFNQICECPDCQALAEYDKPEHGKFSNYVWGFVNQVAKEVGKTHPDRFVGCMAYNTYRQLPDKVKLEPNVYVSFSKYLYWEFDDNYYQRGQKELYDWTNLTSNIVLFEYYCWTMTNRHLQGVPIFAPHWLSEDFKRLKGKVYGYQICGDYGPHHKYVFYGQALYCPSIYLMAELSWDPDLDIDALLDDYYTRFYGPAAGELKQFWTFAEELWCNMNVKKRGPSDGINLTIYTPPVLNRLQGHLDKGLAIAGSDSIYGKRILEFKKWFDPFVARFNNPRNTPQTMVIKKAPRKIVIDGDYDSAWSSAQIVDLVGLMDGQKPSEATMAHLLHDEDYLYALIRCNEPKLDEITTLCTKDEDLGNPPIWEDDGVEIYISPDASHPEVCMHILVNAAGKKVDLSHADGTDNSSMTKEDISYTSNAQIVVKKHYGDGSNPTRQWYVEMAIPKSALNLKTVKLTNNLRINICRTRNVNGIDTKAQERSAWCATISDQLYLPSRFGYATLQE